MKKSRLMELAGLNSITESGNVMDDIKAAVKQLMVDLKDSDSSVTEKDAAMELVIAIADEYGFDLAGHEFDVFYGGDK